MAEENDAPTPEVPPVYRADLTKSMEHIRSYVSVPLRTKPPSTQNPEPSTYGVPSSALPSTPATAPQSTTAKDTETNTDATSTTNPHHRADPTKFGTRHLQDEDDIFAFNAWDDVPLTDDFLSFAEAQYAFQREHPVSAFDAARFNTNPHKWWDRFYANNSANFFKDRKWLFKEFPVLQDVCQKDAGEVRVLEVGCGAGNTAFPLMKECENQSLHLHCCDFSAKAVEVVRRSEMFDPERMSAEVWDVAAAVGSSNQTDNEMDRTASCEQCSLPPGVEPGSIDIVILVFIFSALSPVQWAHALRNLYVALRPGGQILFRDYGRGDLAQVRFKKGRWLGENFYVRGDGTRVYFFEQDELRQIFAGSVNRQTKDQESENDTNRDILADSPSFEIIDLKVDRRMLVNRQRRLKMYRCWMQGHFRKPAAAPVIASSK